MDVIGFFILFLAAELFHELSKALEILTDAAARVSKELSMVSFCLDVIPSQSAYDKILKARKAAEVRHRELSSKRRKLREGENYP